MFCKARDDNIYRALAAFADNLLISAFFPRSMLAIFAAFILYGALLQGRLSRTIRQDRRKDKQW